METCDKESCPSCGALPCDWVDDPHGATVKSSLTDEIEITVVAQRCVYIGNFRVAGGKPYVSENLPQWTFKAKRSDILEALK